MKKKITVLITLILALTISMPVLAAKGNVTYSGNAGEFIFEPGSEHSLTDLFTEFKDVMPGDSITQTITVRNNAKKNVRIWIRSLGADTESVAFLEQLQLSVKVKESTSLFEAPADPSAQLTEWTELGALAPQAEIDLQVELQVPVTLDNNNKSLIGYIDWEFLVEEIDDESGPKTGDTMSYLPWVIGGGVSLFVIGFIVAKRRRHEEDTE